MNIVEVIRKGILDHKYARFFSVFATVFALIYHISFLIAFYLLGVMPMFYFNIFSVSLFTVLSILVCFVKKDSFVGLFHFFVIEVVIHQILADYFVGGVASFHFFILLTGILPLLTFKKELLLASIYGFICVALFAFFEIIATNLVPKYEIPHLAMVIIRSANVILTTSVNFIALVLYSYSLWHKEYSLESKIEQQQLQAAATNQKMLIMQNSIINSLASLVENRDTDTGEHVQRTSMYVELICKKAVEKGIYSDTIDQRFIDLARRAAPLHDIGKIMISDNVLKKPGRLTPEEFELIKVHTTEGGRIISEVVGISEDKDFIHIAEEIATNHHERWDGKGYPEGIMGEKIPLSARIMAVADVFDALVSPRCYKEPMSLEEALVIMKDGRGTHFDPDIVDIFFSIQDEVLEVMNQFKR